MKEDILKIINHYGVKHQLRYFQSEVLELNDAILKEIEIAFNSDGGFGDREALRKEKNHIAKEIADVMVMLKQFQYFYEIPDKEIEDVMKYKVQRQLERINNEK